MALKSGRPGCIERYLTSPGLHSRNRGSNISTCPRRRLRGVMRSQMLTAEEDSHTASRGTPTPHPSTANTSPEPLSAKSRASPAAQGHGISSIVTSLCLSFSSVQRGGQQ